MTRVKVRIKPTDECAPKYHEFKIRLEPTSCASVGWATGVVYYQKARRQDGVNETLCVELRRHPCGPDGCVKVVWCKVVGDQSPESPEWFKRFALKIRECIYAKRTAEDLVKCVKLAVYEHLDEMQKELGYPLGCSVRVGVWPDDSSADYDENCQRIDAYTLEAEIPADGVVYTVTINRFDGHLQATVSDGTHHKHLHEDTELWALVLSADSHVYGGDKRDLRRIKQRVADEFNRAVRDMALVNALRRLFQPA